MIIDIVTIAKMVDPNLIKTIESVNRQQNFSNISLHHIFVLSDLKQSDKIKTKNKNTIILDKETGIYNAFNLAIAKLIGQYTIFLNSGDTFYDQQIMKIFDSGFDESSNKILIGDYVTISGKTKLLNRVGEVTKRNIFLKKCVLNHQSIFYPNIIFQKNSYDNNYKIAGDFDFNIKNINEHNHIKINKAISVVDSNGISNTKRYLSNFEDFLIRISYIKKEKYLNGLHMATLILVRDLLSSTLYHLFKLLSNFRIMSNLSKSHYKIKFLRLFGNRNKIIEID